MGELTRLIKTMLEQREGEEVDFKQEFEPSTEFFVEIAKDIMAFANTNGGCIIFGFEDQTLSLTGVSRCNLSDIRQSDIENALWKLLGRVRFKWVVGEYKGKPVAIIQVPQGDQPIIAIRDGNYTVQGRTKSAFRQGDIYVRRGSQSVRATELADYLRLFPSAQSSLPLVF